MDSYVREVFEALEELVQESKLKKIVNGDGELCYKETEEMKVCDGMLIFPG